MKVDNGKLRVEFVDTINACQAEFGLGLDATIVGRLADYYELVLEHNPLLHLVAPCSPSEFALRHILESLTLLEHLPVGAQLADVGAGAGLPSIPCLVVREDLHAVLIESKEKKAKFLDIAINKLKLEARVKIVNRQFEEADPLDCTVVTCRALDKFTSKLPRLLKWSGTRTKLFFGGPLLEEALQRLNPNYSKRLLPLSERRFIFKVV